MIYPQIDLLRIAPKMDFCTQLLWLLLLSLVGQKAVHIILGIHIYSYNTGENNIILEKYQGYSYNTGENILHQY